MRTWLKKELKSLDALCQDPDPDLHIYESAASTVRDAADRAAALGDMGFYYEYRFVQAMEPRDAVAALSSLLASLTTEPEPEYLTVDQAAARLQVSCDSVYDLVNQGLLKHTKVGRLIRIRPADLDHIQASQDDGW